MLVSVTPMNQFRTFFTEEKAAFDTNSAEMDKGVKGVQLALKVLREYYAKDAAHSSADGAGSGIIGLLEVSWCHFDTPYPIQSPSHTIRATMKRT